MLNGAADNYNAVGLIFFPQSTLDPLCVECFVLVPMLTV